jgi:hypothetical protein
MMADKIDPPDDAPLDLDDINILRKFFLDELARGAARETRLQSDFKALQADNWRLIQKTERDKPPEIWLPLKAASTVDGDRTERQRDTDYERMRKRCENRTIIAERRGKENGRGLWYVRMDDNLDSHGEWAPMLRK